MYSFSHVFLIILDLQVKTAIPYLPFGLIKIYRTYFYEFIIFMIMKSETEGTKYFVGFSSPLDLSAKITLSICKFIKVLLVALGYYYRLGLPVSKTMSYFLTYLIIS